jgi:DNA-directed RNA polymerase subunit RPC12/RpoP
MSEFKTLIRTCPSCGHRFEIRLIEKKLVEIETHEEQVPITKDYFSGWPGSYLELGESEPVTVEVDKFLYVYKCKHCGHEWMERHEKTE